METRKKQNKKQMPLFLLLCREKYICNSESNGLCVVLHSCSAAENGVIRVETGPGVEPDPVSGFLEV
ncbi:hypothetical protein SDC9_89568 [bioreactor metagenome]|uniref:Uncharacterized protein n=1 Tax=bioreactor metagenome TaxID=1076179 RepID=A0A644ZQ66_9ZZZZ